MRTICIKFLLRDLCWCMLVLILLLCAVSYTKVAYLELYLEQQVLNRFVQTSCTIVQRNISYMGKNFDHYHAKVLVRFALSRMPNLVDNTITAWTSASATLPRYQNNYSQEMRNLKQFALNNSYPCWYDPHDPKHVILVLKHDLWLVCSLIFSTLIIIVTLVYLCSELYSAYRAWCNMKQRF